MSKKSILNEESECKTFMWAALHHFGLRHRLTLHFRFLLRRIGGLGLDLMAGIVTQMVAQRTALNERKAKMEQGMMKHMMQHMQTGKESMAQCPMMEGKDSTGKSTEPGEATQEK